MIQDKRVLCIIPARGGSKGIPRKNVRLLADKPLISYAIESAKGCKYVDKVIVSTDDEEIANVASIFGAEPLKRPDELAKDAATLDPVIFHAVNELEKDGVKYDLVITLQPTAPLLTSETLGNAITQFVEEGADTLISASDETHLYWTRKDGSLVPMYKKRLNRQYLDPIYKENGAIFISARSVVKQDTRFGTKVTIFEMPKDESYDIDNYEDWIVSEMLLRRKNVAFVVIGKKETGIGHVHRTIALANRIFDYNVEFFVQRDEDLAISIIKKNNRKITEYQDENDLLNKLGEAKISIVVNDILNTEKEYILQLKKQGFFVVNFEDFGEGSSEAHLLINALYEHSAPGPNQFFGDKYVCIRDEFQYQQPKRHAEDVKKILITFGGTDPNNLTIKTLDALQTIDAKEPALKVIVGPGYSHLEELKDKVDKMKKDGFNIDYSSDIPFMSNEMVESDLAITSNGRTVYELASLCVPLISLAQNAREMTHTFAMMCKGVKFMGMGIEVSVEELAQEIKYNITNPKRRQEMIDELCKFDIRGGIDRTLKIIFDGFEEKTRQ